MDKEPSQTKFHSSFARFFSKSRMFFPPFFGLDLEAWVCLRYSIWGSWQSYPDCFTWKINQICFFFTPTWGRFPFWLIFFRWDDEYTIPYMDCNGLLVSTINPCNLVDIFVPGEMTQLHPRNQRSVHLGSSFFPGTWRSQHRSLVQYLGPQKTPCFGWWKSRANRPRDRWCYEPMVLKFNWIWSKYSELTRPGPPKGNVLEGKSPYFRKI